MGRYGRILRLVLVALAVVLGVLVYQNSRQDQPEWIPPPPPASESPQAQEPAAPARITSTLGYFGDIVCHTGLNQDARQPDGSYDYTALFQGAAPYIERQITLSAPWRPPSRRPGSTPVTPCSSLPRPWHRGFVSWVLTW